VQRAGDSQNSRLTIDGGIAARFVKKSDIGISGMDFSGMLGFIFGNSISNPPG